MSAEIFRAFYGGLPFLGKVIQANLTSLAVQ
jgi:hypothetical protein